MPWEAPRDEWFPIPTSSMVPQQASKTNFKAVGYHFFGDIDFMRLLVSLGRAGPQEIDVLNSARERNVTSSFHMKHITDEEWDRLQEEVACHLSLVHLQRNGQPTYSPRRIVSIWRMTADAIYYWLVGRAHACSENGRIFRRSDAIFFFALSSPEMPTTMLRLAMMQRGRGTRPPADANYSLLR